MSVRMSIAASSQETGALLKQYLRDLGVYDPSGLDVVCYGAPSQGRRTLNQACGSGKIERLARMNAAGVQTVPWFSAKEWNPQMWKPVFPLLARKNYGFGGTDIVPVFQYAEIPWRMAAGYDWFSEYVDVDEELRVWVFQGAVLDTYAKVMQRPEEYKYIGRNFRNGFEFQLCEGTNDAAEDLAVRAVHALGLDFGAVDLIVENDEDSFVLEVNTAPGVIRSGAQATLGKLADHIALWSREA